MAEKHYTVAQKDGAFMVQGPLPEGIDPAIFSSTSYDVVEKMADALEHAYSRSWEVPIGQRGELKFGLPLNTYGLVKGQARKELLIETRESLLADSPRTDPSTDPLFNIYERICALQRGGVNFFIPAGLSPHQFQTYLVIISNYHGWKQQVSLKGLIDHVARGIFTYLEDSKYGREDPT